MARARSLMPALAMALSIATPAVAAPECKPLPGAAGLLSKPGLRYVLVGEIHGTVEAPAAFRDLVCNAAASSHRTVVVGLERNTREQPAIDAFLAPDNHEAATTALLAGEGWNVLDGRSSQAMLTLLEDLRSLKSEGRISAVVAFDDARTNESSAQRNERMAAALIAAARRDPNSLVIALTGNLHASKRPMERFGSYPFMAMLTPPAETISLFVTDQGGEAWTQTQDGCRPHKMRASGTTSRGIVLSETAAPMAGFDGVLSTGAASTASLPAIRNAPPVPACSEVK